MPTIELSQGKIDYIDEGGGTPVLCVHGYLMGGELWGDLARELVPSGFRVIRPTWPLGAHRHAVEGNHDRGPAGVAATVADFMEALDLNDVILVGNDSGGAISQMVVTTRPERVGRLVLTNCDAFDNFPPSFFKALVALAKVPGALRIVLAPMRLAAIRRSPLGFGLLSHRDVDDLARQWVSVPGSDPRIFEDLRLLTAGFDKRLTLEAAKKLPGFRRPVLLAWATDDRLFPRAHAERLATLLPDARLELIENSRCFSMIDRPERLADLITDFAAHQPSERPAA